MSALQVPVPSPAIESRATPFRAVPSRPSRQIAQLPFVLVRISVVKTDGQVRHKVQAGAHFLVARDKARASVTSANAPF